MKDHQLHARAATELAPPRMRPRCRFCDAGRYPVSVRDPRVIEAVRRILGPDWRAPQASVYAGGKWLEWQTALNQVTAPCARHETQVHLLTEDEQEAARQLALELEE